jgi:hypothetical protein
MRLDSQAPLQFFGSQIGPRRAVERAREAIMRRW